eukprot:9889411-Heterocapsa_arctica.AAC.1
MLNSNSVRHSKSFTGPLLNNPRRLPELPLFQSNPSLNRRGTGETFSLTSPACCRMGYWGNCRFGTNFCKQSW